MLLSIAQAGIESAEVKKAKVRAEKNAAKVAKADEAALKKAAKDQQK
eukprot:SAG11_NODE_33227_length_278_cov_1.128492_1_plen_46_part_10